jgi:hypothetical protein
MLSTEVMYLVRRKRRLKVEGGAYVVEDSKGGCDGVDEVDSSEDAGAVGEWEEGHECAADDAECVRKRSLRWWGNWNFDMLLTQG